MEHPAATSLQFQVVKQRVAFYCEAGNTVYFLRKCASIRQTESNLDILVRFFFCFSVSKVAECVLELVMDETKTGEALVVNPKGKTYVECPVFIS